MFPLNLYKNTSIILSTIQFFVNNSTKYSMISFFFLHNPHTTPSFIHLHFNFSPFFRARLWQWLLLKIRKSANWFRWSVNYRMTFISRQISIFLCQIVTSSLIRLRLNSIRKESVKSSFLLNRILNFTINSQIGMR